MIYKIGLRFYLVASRIWLALEFVLELENASVSEFSEMGVVQIFANSAIMSYL